MNLQQLEYIIAVDTYRHFVTAAEKCFVTQATLSMMIKKLEEELNVKIFDRSRQPVVPTAIGEKIIAQAKVILHEANKLSHLVNDEQNDLKGELRIGIIPTLAPYLLPIFLPDFLKKCPNIKLEIKELTTEEIVRKLEQNDLDAGLLAIPLNNNKIKEIALFYEDFVIYASDNEQILAKNFVIPEDIDPNRLWLLEEGHCLRDQVINLCELKAIDKEIHQLNFAAGSIETLKKLVEMQKGMTILPELALSDFTKEQQARVRFFKPPVPKRAIGLVTYRYFMKEKLINALKTEIIKHLPATSSKPN
jgi:LysR family transcriptional regulator, hydrogen peroxide-inducible genes activator